MRYEAVRVAKRGRVVGRVREEGVGGGRKVKGYYFGVMASEIGQQVLWIGGNLKVSVLLKNAAIHLQPLISLTLITPSKNLWASLLLASLF